MLGTSGQACRSLSVDILPDPTSNQPQTNPKSPNRIACSHTHSHLRWCLFGLHLVALVFNSCFHFLWLSDQHFCTRLPPCSHFILSRSLSTCDLVRMSSDRNFLTRIVSVYPNPLANRLCSSSACVRQCASGSGAATGVPGFCFQKLKCQISSSVERYASLVLTE